MHKLAFLHFSLIFQISLSLFNTKSFSPPFVQCEPYGFAIYTLYGSLQHVKIIGVVVGGGAMLLFRTQFRVQGVLILTCMGGGNSNINFLTLVLL